MNKCVRWIITAADDLSNWCIKYAKRDTWFQIDYAIDTFIDTSNLSDTDDTSNCYY